MRKIVTAAAALAALSFVNSANAADMPTKAPAYEAAPPLVYNWTGFYLGINGGGAWGHEDWTDNVAVGAVTHRPDGGVFGGQVGFRWQWNQLVLGVEGTWDWAGLSDTVNGAGPFGLSEDFKVRSLYTITPQVGWAWDRFLVYAKGGWAGATTKAEFSLPGLGISGSHSQTVNGWTVGGGIDYAIWQNLVLGVEYDHFDFTYDGFTAPVIGPGTPWIVTNTSRLTVDQVVARLSYKFDWPR